MLLNTERNVRTENDLTVEQRWKKLSKQHWQNYEPEKLAHKICAKKAQNRARISKNGKNYTKNTNIA